MSGLTLAFLDWSCDPARPGHSAMSDLIWGMALPLATGGDDIHVVGPYPRPLFAGPVHVHQHWNPPAHLGHRNILGHLALALAARQRALRIPGVRIVHAAEYFSTSLFTARTRSPAVVMTTPGNIFERIENVNHFDRTVTRTYEWAARRTARTAAAVVATSDEMARWWRLTGVSERRLHTIPLGVDRAVFRPIADARSRLNWPADRPVVLFVGRVDAENGLEYLIRGMPDLLTAVPNAAIVVVGRGQEEPPLRALAAELGVAAATQWVGAVPFDQLPLYYGAANVLALPRLSRVTARVALQAMACATPVVAFRIGGIVDFVRDGEAGLLADPGDPVDFAQKLVRLLREPELARTLGDRGGTFAAEHLGWDVVTRRLRDEVYTKIT